METTDLERVEQAAFAVADAREEFETAIRAAHANGAALRTIAEAAGVSHEQVRRMIRTDQPSGR